MALPSVTADSADMAWYGSEVAGRLIGITRVDNLVTDPERRAPIARVGEAIGVAARTLFDTHIARLTHEYVTNRVTVGIGRGLDRGWDGLVSETGQTSRLSLPDRSTDNPDYRAVFPNGRTDEYTGPAIGRDPEVATELRRRLASSSIPAREPLVARIDAMMPLLTTGAADVEAGDSRTNELFAAEMAARQALVTMLWEERKTVERLLGRAGRNLARFVFFDYTPKKTRDAVGETTAPEPTTRPEGEPE